MSDNVTKSNSDDEMNRNTYKAVMDFSAKFGVPAAVGLTVMFTSLVMANGFFMSLFVGFASFMFTIMIVKMFFSH